MYEQNKLYVTKAKLEGCVKLSGAKNSALRLLAASLLSKETIELHNYPSELLDAQVHVDMLRALGKKVELLSNDVVHIQEEDCLKSQLDWKGRSIRNTLLILGALTARLGAGSVPLPGGCKLGERKYDLHVMLLEKLGAKVWDDEEYLYAEAPNGLVGADIYLSLIHI